MTSTIGEGIVRELNNLRLNLSHLWVLEKYNKEEEISSELALLVPPLERKGFIMNRNITEAGRTFLNNLLSGAADVSKEFKATVKRMAIEHEGSFDIWWSTYPRNSDVKSGERLIKGRRPLRMDKVKCKAMFLKILKEGEYTASDIIKALEYEVNMRVADSLKKGQNQLDFMKASPAYLNQRAFEAFTGMQGYKDAIEVPKTNYTVDL